MQLVNFEDSLEWLKMELEPNEVISLWFHYEEITMHFNQLIIQYRLQLMGGAGAIGAIGTYLVRSTEDLKHYHLRSLFSAWLFVLILGAAVLDICYYSQLLEGAVKAIIEFERMHPTIKLSTTIAAEVPGSGLATVIFWYSVILGSLAIFSLWSYYRYRQLKNCN
ncbi:MAG: hypothetical protein CMM59_14940 [Rhodospirillaceae bacterium]|nr:hypothetical protein [Rhodospirillaceae bacterium]